MKSGAPIRRVLSTHNRLALPPDYLLRAPEPAAQTPEQPAASIAETTSDTAPETEE